MAFVTIKDKDNATLGHLQTDAQERLGIHNLLHVQDQKAVGTNGGAFTSGAWRTRTLNELVVNNIVGASLASNQITLPPGSYYAEGRCLAFKIGSNVLRLYDITSSGVLLSGFTRYASSDANSENLNALGGIFAIAAESILELQHASAESHNSGCGTAGGSNIGQLYNVYSDLKIWKVA